MRSIRFGSTAGGQRRVTFRDNRLQECELRMARDGEVWLGTGLGSMLLDQPGALRLIQHLIFYANTGTLPESQRSFDEMEHEFELRLDGEPIAWVHGARQEALAEVANIKNTYGPGVEVFQVHKAFEPRW